MCLIQQQSIIKNKQKNVCTSVVQKKKKLYEMFIWSKKEKFSSKQDKI
jgi:hypothetical protein